MIKLERLARRTIERTRRGDARPGYLVFWPDYDMDDLWICSEFLAQTFTGDAISEFERRGNMIILVEWMNEDEAG